jgi:hypothetical protein
MEARKWPGRSTTGGNIDLAPRGTAAMKRRLCTACWLLLVAPAVGRAQEDAPSQATEARAANEIEIPYAFYNDLFGATGAFLYARSGFLQKQSQLVATGMIGTAGSGMLFLREQDLLVPGFDRLFVDPIFSLAYFHGDYAYVSGNPQYPRQQAGTNGSASGNYITGNGWDNYLRISFRYLLPIGWGRDHVVPDYRLEGGLLVSGATGGEALNPLASGRTFVELRPFYRSLTLDSSSLKTSQKTNGLDASLIWDNRDFVTNPSVGQSMTLRCSRDFGWLDSTNAWTVVAGELDQYFSLGRSDWFRQRVIALDVWTANSPSWDYRPNGTIANRPPTFAGAHLGGWWRMRGYRFARFSDKAAVYYAAEYRMIPRWNPFTSSRWLQERLGVEWLQLVPFAEVGRVAPAWNLSELHSSMKWDLGFGLRLLARGLLVRVDLAGSREGAAVQMMMGQPFQF